MTLREVAQMAGVSPASVSRYLNGGPLSQGKRAAIRAVIERTGYYPNQAAHTLRTGKLKQVGVVVPRIHSETVSQVTAGIEEVLSEEGYLPVLGSTDLNPEREMKYLELLNAFHVSGVIHMARAVPKALLEFYRDYPVPLVITGQNLTGFHCVFHDDYHAMKELAGRLILRGRRKICYIGVDEDDVAVGQERLRGAQDALYAAGHNAEEMPVAVADFTWESGYQRMKEMLESFPDTDGVLCATDTIAQGAILALRECGRVVPGDVSVAGVGDDWADLVSIPRLTVARLDQIRCGRMAASILLRLLARPDAAPAQIMLGYTIIDRESI